MSDQTARLSLKYPLDGDQVSAFTALFEEDVLILDESVLVTQGTTAAIPAAGSLETNHFYRATDTNQWYVTDGVSWHQLALIASPTFTGTPRAPTATALTNSTQVASTAYADAAVAVEKGRAQTTEGTLAPKASPALTGNPTTPNQSPGTSNTRIANTAYADAAVAVETARAESVEGNISLSPTLYNGSGTTLVEPGTFVGMANANTTATLRDGHCTVGSVLGVRAGAGLSGSGPVTVNTQGATITLPGQNSGVSSIKLGMASSFAVFVYDGGSYRCIAGGQDTGWVQPASVTGSLNAVVSGFYPIAYRLVNDQVFFQGVGRAFISTSIAPGTTLFTLPVAYRPNQIVYLPTVIVDNGDAAVIEVDPNGQVSINNYNLTAQEHVCFDGLNFSIV